MGALPSRVPLTEVGTNRQLVVPRDVLCPVERAPTRDAPTPVMCGRGDPKKSFELLALGPQYLADSVLFQRFAQGPA